MNPIHSPGNWWLPESPGRVLNGNLDFEPGESIDLVTYGALVPNQQILQFGQHPYIHGYAGRQTITLRACAQSSGSTSQPGGVTTAHYDALQIYSGAHVPPEGEILYSVWHCDVTHFQTWLGADGFSDDRTENEDGSRQVGISLTILPDIPLHESSDGVVSATFLANGPSREYTNRESVLRQTARLTIRPIEPQAEPYFWRVLHRWCHLLTLLIGKPVKIVSIDARSSAVTIGIEDQQHETSIQIGRLQTITDKDKKFAHAHEMPLPREQIVGNLQSIADRFFELESTLAPAFELFIENEFSMSANGEVQFLNAVRALETFHRRTSDETDLPAEEHDNRIAGIIQGSPDVHREWLSQRLFYSNELTLRRRIRTLVDAIPELHSALPGGRSNFINRVVSNRNYLTHFSAELESGRLRGNALHTATDYLELILAISFLKILNVPHDTAWNAFRRRLHNIQTTRFVSLEDG